MMLCLIRDDGYYRAYELEKDRIPEELAADGVVKKAVEKLDVMYLDREEREIYENDLKRLRDCIAEMKTTEIRRMEKGERNKALQIDKNLLDVLDNETISIKIGLSIKERQKLR